MKTLIFTCIFAIGRAFAQTQSQPLETNVIQVEVAQFVANQHVHSNNAPFEWRHVDYIVLHDLNGDAAAYAFVFSKLATEFRSADDLKLRILKKAEYLLGVQSTVNPTKSQSNAQTGAAIMEAEENLFGVNDFATVITGANTVSPLILRHFRGIPEFWIKKEVLDSKSTMLENKTLGLYGVIMINPSDFRLVQLKSQDHLAKIDLRKPLKLSIPNSARTLKIRTAQVEEFGEVKKVRQNIESRKIERINTLEPAARQNYERSLRERAVALQKEWEAQRQLWMSKQMQERQVR